MAAHGIDDGSTSPLPRHLTPAQVAELLALPLEQVMGLVHEGMLQGLRIGSPAVWRIDQRSVEAYLREQAEDARRHALWNQSQVASFPELWGTPGLRS